MRTFRIVAFWAMLAALMGSLIIYGKCMAHPVYDERGNIVGETLEAHSSSSAFEAQGGEDDITLTVSRHYPDIIPILRECLEFIEDGSVDQNRALQAAIYRPLTRDGVAQDEADRAQREAERYRRETALHGKIKEMITKLEGSK